MCFHRQLCENGIFFINDFNEFLNTYNVNINFVETMVLLSVILNNCK